MSKPSTIMVDKVYLVICKSNPINVFDTKEKAFQSLPKKDGYTKYTQVVRTIEGEEEIIPTKDSFYMNIPICVQIESHTENTMGINIEIPGETIFFEIKEFKIK